ncbi:hypothetical protein [Taibaiella soli]|uniref:Uncharacterized protein n=1 Tax=Taibaiella soli TaxID=1649169 RepID=A0A2W2BBR7_9BACT|nr:hypothetical protein [Taibaiella soli]PZF73659.1 hypothetical protein DN068_06580 [Taibaiella soli]
MVRATENKLIIEIDTCDPAAMLRDLQESLITVLQRYNEDGRPDRIDDVNCLALLKALLPETELYEKMLN